MTPLQPFSDDRSRALEFACARVQWDLSTERVAMSMLTGRMPMTDWGLEMFKESAKRFLVSAGKTVISIMGMLTLGAPPTSKAADRIFMQFDVDSGQPIANGLTNPGSWVFLGTRTIPNKMQTMTWVRPIGMTPREVRHLDQKEAVKVYVLIGKPRESFSGEYSESFEYQDLARPRGKPQQYFDAFKQQQLQACPSGIVAPISVNETELILEAKSGGCERFGDQDEIDRFLFGRRDLFHMVYSVKLREMTAEQHAAAMKAVTAWQMLK